MLTQNRAKHAGFTLIEAISTLAIVAILAGFATSSFSAGIYASRTGSGFSTLLASLTRAATEASRTEMDVILCPSIDGEYCSSDDHWENGWIAFQAIRPGNDRTMDEPIVFREGPLPSKVQLVTSKGRTRLRFQPNGGNAGSNATFTFCDGRGQAKASAYALSNRGDLHAAPPNPEYVADACLGI